MSESQLKGIENVSFVSGALCLDFTNTVHRFDSETATDEIVSYETLVRWAERSEAIDAATAISLNRQAAKDSDQADNAVRIAREFRRKLFHVFTALAADASPVPADLAAIRDFWQEALAASDLVPTDTGFKWQSDTGASLPAVLHNIVHSAIDLLQSPEISRIRLCGADDCTWLFVDRSKNGSRRWCQMDVCGNRAKAKRHYDRNRATS
jgi:predicted RNA-binding Zn ribbon-like protein